MNYNKEENNDEMQTFLLLQTLLDSIPGTFIYIASVSFSLRIADPDAVFNISFYVSFFFK